MEKGFLALTGECNANKMFFFYWVQFSSLYFVCYCRWKQFQASINQTLKWKYYIVKGCCRDYFILLNRRCLRKNKFIYLYIYFNFYSSLPVICKRSTGTRNTTKKRLKTPCHPNPNEYSHKPFRTIFLKKTKTERLLSSPKAPQLQSSTQCLTVSHGLPSLLYLWFSTASQAATEACCAARLVESHT